MRGSGAQVVKSAQLAGASQVIGVDPTLSKRQRALSFGATHVFTPEEALHAIRELTDGREVDHLIEAAGVRNTLQAAWYTVLTAANMVVLGKLPVDGHVSLRWGAMLGDKRFIRSSYGGARPHRYFPELLELHRSGDYPLGELIEQRISLTQINEGFAKMRRGENIRTVIEF